VPTLMDARHTRNGMLSSYHLTIFEDLTWIPPTISYGMPLVHERSSGSCYMPTHGKYINTQNTSGPSLFGTIDRASANDEGIVASSPIIRLYSIMYWGRVCIIKSQGSAKRPP
jgi:hypothetical protein